MSVSLKNTPSLADVLADETSKGVTQRERFSHRLDRYGKAKSKATAISNYISQNQPDREKLATRVKECGNYLTFRDYYTVGEIRLTRACFCKKHLLCPLCAIRRGAKLLGRYVDRFHDVAKSDPELKPYLVTFTVKNGPDLQERFLHLQKSIRSYHKRRHRKRSKCEAKKASGAVWSYEIKRGKNSGSWHPHVHAVWLCKTPPNSSLLSEEWKSVTGDSFIVDVRPISQDDPVSGFLEVFKYAVKFSDQPEHDTWHCYEILSGRRLIASFGDFYGIPEPEDLLDECLDDLPYIEYFYQFMNGSYQSFDRQRSA